MIAARSVRIGWLPAAGAVCVALFVLPVAAADEVAVTERRIRRPAFIPREFDQYHRFGGTAEDPSWAKFLAECGRREELLAAYERGNAVDQLDELLIQCGVKAIVDLGRGWKGVALLDPEDGSRWEYEPHHDLDWPAFEAGPEAEGALPIVGEVLDAFFADRPALRWEPKGDHVYVEPVDRWKRMGWLLTRKLAEPVECKPHADRGWVVYSDDVREAVVKTFPEWKRDGTEFYICPGMRGFGWIGMLPNFEVYFDREMNITTLGEFVQAWLRQTPCAYVVVQEHFRRTEGPPPHAKVEVTLTEWNPARLSATTDELVAGFREDSRVPPGYSTSGVRSKYCERELMRRHHFDPEAVIDALKRAGVVEDIKSYYGDDRTDLVEMFDPDGLGAALRERFWPGSGK